MTTMTNTDELTMKVAQLQDAVDRVEYKLDHNNKVLSSYVGKKGKLPEDEDEVGARVRGDILQAPTMK